MIDPNQFTIHIIRPALEAIDLYSDAAAELVLGTALQESNLRYLVQLGSGPAKGFFQMEPATHDDIWTNFLAYKPELASKVNALVCHNRSPEKLIWNLHYAAAMCRVHYYRVKSALPEQGDYEGHANYWKTYYNTIHGAGTEEEYLENWHKYLS